MKIYFLLALLVLSTLGQTQSITISSNSELSVKADSLSLFIWDHFFSESKRMITGHRVIRQESKAGSFRFQADSICAPVYMSLMEGSTPNNKHKELLKLYLIEPGNNITIGLSEQGKLLFTGKGARNFEYQYRLDTLSENINNYFRTDHAKFDDFKNRQYLSFEKKIFHQIDSLHSAQLKLLESYKNALSVKGYQLFEAELLGKYVQLKYLCYSSLVRNIKSYGIESTGQCDSAVMYQVFLDGVKGNKIAVSDSILVLSREYITSRIQIIMAVAAKDANIHTDDFILKNYDGILRDQLLTSFLIESFDFIPSADSVLEIALQNIRTPYCREPLLSMQNRLSRGSLAYNFVLEDANGKYTMLSDFLGKAVFLDFWYTGCTGCVQLYKNALADIEQKYKNDSSVVFITVSIDKDKDTWMQSIKGKIYTSEDAVNLNTGKLGADHPVINRYGVTFFPKTFLIDKTGRILRNTTSIRKKEELQDIIKNALK